METIRSHKLDNGLTLVGQGLPGVASGAFSILVPVGASRDDEGFEGSATLLSEMFHKGAGPWNSKELSEEFEAIGAHRGHSAGIEASVFSGSLLGENLIKVLEMYKTVLLEPRFPEEELLSVKSVALQELYALEDEPSSKVMVELAKQFYPGVFGRSHYGTIEGVNAVTIDSLRDYYKRHFMPNNAVIGVAGKFDWNEIKDTVSNCFSNWQGGKDRLQPGPLGKENKNHHIEQDTSQLQIALAYPSVDYAHPDYYKARVAVGVLSGGMSGRLFIEVREKRGLVYRVSASHSGSIGRAAIICFAGTTPENGQETLDVMLAELKKLKDGVSEEELQRAKADLKSRVIIQGEFSNARASSICNDWWNLGRVRTLEDCSCHR